MSERLIRELAIALAVLSGLVFILAPYLARAPWSVQ